MTEGVGDLAVEHVERLGAGRGDLADLATHRLVESGAARAFVHGVRCLGLLDSTDLVALGDERVGESAVGDLGEAGVSVVAFHVGETELFHGHHCVLMIQFVEFANLKTKCGSCCNYLIMIVKRKKERKK